jgi:hypothetical protein
MKLIPMSLLTALRTAKIPAGKIVEILTFSGVRRLARHDGDKAFLGTQTTGRIKGYTWEPASPLPRFTAQTAEVVI